VAGDPFRIFREAGSARQENLKILWPELYSALALPAGSSKPNINCVVHSTRYPGEHEVLPAVGRLTLNGQPACRRCIEALSDRVSGYPLELTDPRTWKP